MARRLGILGGTFDPIHAGHVLLAQYALEGLALDRVLFVPAADPPHKDHGVTPAEQRWEMVCLALAGLPHLEPSRVELDRGGVSYTVDTLRQVRAEHPGDELFLLIGADNVSEMATWQDPEGILDLATVVAGARGDPPGPAATGLAARVVHLATPVFQVSSTEVRRRLRQGRPVRYLVPPAVEDYIHLCGLYGAS